LGPGFAGIVFRDEAGLEAGPSGSETAACLRLAGMVVGSNLFLAGDRRERVCNLKAMERRGLAQVHKHRYTAVLLGQVEFVRGKVWQEMSCQVKLAKFLSEV
jgi:hypothetical protein